MLSTAPIVSPRAHLSIKDDLSVTIEKATAVSGHMKM